MEAGRICGFTIGQAPAMNRLGFEREKSMAERGNFVVVVRSFFVCLFVLTILRGWGRGRDREKGFSPPKRLITFERELLQKGRSFRRFAHSAFLSSSPFDFPPRVKLINPIGL